MNYKSPLFFPDGYGAVVRAVKVGIEARAWTHLNKGLVECAACHCNSPAYSKEAGVYLGRFLVVVGVKRHYVAEVAIRNSYTAMPLQFYAACRKSFCYIAYGKGIRPRPEPLSLHIDIVYVDFTVRCRFVI